MLLNFLKNWQLKRIFERHEVKRVYLPPAGFEVPRYPSDEEVQRAIHSVPRHRVTASYFILNSSMPTTAAPVKQPTGTAIRTMMQLLAATGVSFRIIEWGCSFDGSSAATPGQVELVGTDTVGASQSGSNVTAYAAADIMTFGDPNAVANTAGTGGVPFNLGTSASMFATAAPTEGTVTTTRYGDFQMLPPTGPYVKQFPLGREPTFGYWGGAQHYTRVRMTFGTTVNTSIYLICEV